MYAVFGKSLQKERASTKPYAKSTEERFKSNAHAYQISSEYSSEECALQFIELCKGKEHIIRPLFIATLQPMLDKKGEVKKDKKTQKDRLKFQKYKEIQQKAA